MAKSIKLTYKGAEYVLEFTRKTVEAMEESGFRIRELRDKPVTTLPTLFKGAFLAHCSYLKDDVLNDIYETLGNKKDFMEKLIDMYNEPVETLFDEPQPSEKNAQWEANW